VPFGARNGGIDAQQAGGIGALEGTAQQLLESVETG